MREPLRAKCELGRRPLFNWINTPLGMTRRHNNGMQCHARLGSISIPLLGGSGGSTPFFLSLSLHLLICFRIFMLTLEKISNTSLRNFQNLQHSRYWMYHLNFFTIFDPWYSEQRIPSLQSSLVTHYSNKTHEIASSPIPSSNLVHLENHRIIPWIPHPTCHIQSHSFYRSKLGLIMDDNK